MFIVFFFFHYIRLTKRLITEADIKEEKENYNSKREDLEEEGQGEDERNVIL